LIDVISWLGFSPAPYFNVIFLWFYIVFNFFDAILFSVFFRVVFGSLPSGGRLPRKKKDLKNLNEIFLIKS